VTFNSTLLMLTPDWDDVRRSLEPFVRGYRDDRIARDHKRRVSSRKGIAQKLCDDFKKSSAAAIFPGLNAVIQFPGFKELINSVSARELEPEDFSEVMKELPTLLAEWVQKKKDSLIASLPSMPILEEGEIAMDRRLLATCIFQCNNRDCAGHSKAFTFDQAMAHECEHKSQWNPCLLETRLVYSERGSAAATSVVTALGLDVRTAVPADLDALQTGVGCAPCINGKGKPMQLLEWFEFVRINFLHLDVHSH
jgi:hypothetical protein